MAGRTTSKRYLAGLVVAALIVAGCGGGDDDSSAAETSSTVESSTTTVAEATTTTAAETTTTTAETTTTESPTVGAEAIAEASLLTVEDLGIGWTEEPDDNSDPDYSQVPGCEFMVELVENDGRLTEADSSEFVQGDVSIEQSVRVYADVATATDVVLAWAELSVRECIVDAIEVEVGEALTSGELAPFEGATFDLLLFDDHVGEPRVTNLELTTVFTGPDIELTVVADLYLIQVGEVVSAITITTPDAVWDARIPVLDEVVAKMNAALAAG